MELKEVIKAINTISDFEDNKDSLVEELSKSDTEISDLLHFLENENFNARDGYKVAKRIKEARQKRRKAKNGISLIQTFEQNSNKLINSDNRRMLISILGREEKRLSNTEYNYRIIDKEEIIK